MVTKQLQLEKKKLYQIGLQARMKINFLHYWLKWEGSGSCGNCQPWAGSWAQKEADYT